MNNLIANPYFMAYVGWFLYNLYLLIKDQKEFDQNNNGYGLAELGKWFRYHWVSILFSATLVLVCVPYTSFLWGLKWPDLEFVSIGYYLLGFASIPVQILIKKMST